MQRESIFNVNDYPIKKMVRKREKNKEVCCVFLVCVKLRKK